MTGDVGEVFNELKLQRKKKRQSNLEYSTALLQEIGVEFDSKNYGLHLIVNRPSYRIDFWPSTGRWIQRGGKQGRGVKNLIKFLENNP